LIFSEYIGVDFEDSYSYVVDKSYINQIKFKTKTFKLFFSKIRQYINQDSDVLEIGSYYGILGNIIKPHVKNYTGLELSRHATQYSKKKFNLNILNQSLTEFLKNRFQFDVVIMTDVIEHLDRPFKILNLIEKNLKPGGILILSTFNIDSIIPRIMRGKYYWIIPQHKYYFSNSTLKYFLNKSNLDLFKIKTDARMISLEYLLNTLIILMPKLTFIFKFFLKFNFLKKLTLKINLLDLNLYFARKNSTPNN
jgi:2-polyprenyl-3-methyl-5-hydroxy-6-metoxy-1,4-benzoquinol methylase